MKRCEYCGETRDLTVDHVVPISAILPGKRKGAHKSLSVTLIACRECNSLLGTKRYYTKQSRALYLVETYANRLQNYSIDDQVYLLDKLKSCVLSYEKFLVEYLDGNTEEERRKSKRFIYKEIDEDVERGPLTDDNDEIPIMNQLSRKKMVSLADLEGLVLHDIDVDSHWPISVTVFQGREREWGDPLEKVKKRLKRRRSSTLLKIRDEFLRDFQSLFSTSELNLLADSDEDLLFIALSLHEGFSASSRKLIYHSACLL